MRKKIAIFGLMLILGLGNLVMAEVWEKIEATGTLPEKKLPEERSGHVFIENFVFGGFGQDPDLWILREEGGGNWRWEYVVAKGTAPTPRGGHSGIFAGNEAPDKVKNSIIIFGGSQSFMETLVDTETYKLSSPWDPNSAWETLPTTGTVPSPRAEHTAVYDYSNKMVVFGGYTSTGSVVAVSSETYTLDFSFTPASWTKLDTSGEEIPVLYGHSAVWAEMGMETGMIVFGGKDSLGNLLDDCWELVESTWTKISVTGDKPPARCQHTAVWTWGEQGGEMIIFGGKKDENGNPLDDIWVLHQPGPFEPLDWKWEKIYPIGDLPSARAGHAAALGWGREGQQMFIFGGSYGNNNFNDIYTFFRGERVKETLQKKPFNAPNPFNPDIEDTKICYYLEEDDDDVKIKLFTLTGELVYSWENIPGREGMNDESWDGRNEKGRVVENGGYICLIEAGGKKQKCKIAVLR